jgi:hypothetical protein
VQLKIVSLYPVVRSVQLKIVSLYPVRLAAPAALAVCSVQLKIVFPLFSVRLADHIAVSSVQLKIVSLYPVVRSVQL